MRIRRAAVLACVAAAGCWYGPAEEVVQVEHAIRRHNSRAVAVAVVAVSRRPPRGLATFPNGGVPRMVEASVRLYFGNPARGWLRHASDVTVPGHVLHGTDVRVEGFDQEAAYLTISGCAQNECWGDLRAFERLKVLMDGTVERVDSVPEAARPGGESVARMQGESLYMRIGYDQGAVEASLDPEQEREVVFRLDPDSGALRLAEPYPFPGPSASGVDPERQPEAGGLWSLEPGKRFGSIGPASSEAQVREQYGHTSTRPADVHIGEGFCAPGLRVFPGEPREFEVAWSDASRARPAFVRTAGSEWRTPAGVGVGSTLTDLERMNGGPVEFSGFGWDYGGRLRWQEDSGEVLLQLAIDPTSMPRLTELATTDPRVSEIDGDRTGPASL